MQITGTIRKMKTERKNAKDPVRYSLPLEEPAGTGATRKSATFEMNQAVGSKKALSLVHSGKIYCIRCGKSTKKSFAQGYCFPCFQKAPETSECVLRPELCRAHEGESRDLEWSKTHCLIEHVVYLALSSDVKVGITRGTQIPTRWIDQGAHEAILLAKTPNRYTAGLIEVALKKHLTDRTDWRKMLKDERADRDLAEARAEIIDKLPADLRQYAVTGGRKTAIQYPVTAYPEKVKSVGFDKEQEISGKLLGIKGQYLIFDDNRVINIRKHQGYEITLKF